MKATARAYAIQGLIKYHGLRNEGLRIPYHDSISVCMKSLPTKTTVELRPDLSKDLLRIDGKVPQKVEFDRVAAVVDALRNMSKEKSRLRIESRNPGVKGKGLGFSAAGFAALGLATSKALGLELSRERLSEIVRLGAGSAARSLVGGFSIWYANRRERSYAEMIAPADAVKLKTIIVPVPSKVKTDMAHRDVLTSPFYTPRVRYVAGMLSKMKRAISHHDVRRIAELSEIDTLNLHAVTMTGEARMILFSPLSIRIIEEVQSLRYDGIPAWFSLDTGPSVFVNTTQASASKVHYRISRLAETVISDPGGPADIVREHVF
jgi:phosphomevalonate decarboxylase